MKKTTLTVTIFLFAFLMNAQNENVYVMKDNSIVAQYNVTTEIDSIIFYDPNEATTPQGGDVPFFDMTGIDYGPAGTITGTSVGFFQRDGRFDQYVWNSPTIGGLAGFDILLPPSYETSPEKKYPVIYHLHGHGETQSGYSYNGSQQTNLPTWWGNESLGEFIWISVGGPTQGWWSDGEDGTMAESHIINELLSLVDQQFRTLATKEGRAITGFSMGGFGATKIGMKYPDYFTVVGSWCGAIYSFDTQDNGDSEGFQSSYSGNFTDIWNDDMNLYANDCARKIITTKATELINKDLDFVIHCNTGDPIYYPINNSFVEELDALSIPNTYTTDGGGHSMGNLTAGYYNSILSHMSPAQ